MTGKELIWVLLAVAFLLTMIIGHIGIRENAVIIGDTGILAAIMSALTVLGVAAAAFSAWSSHRSAQETLALSVDAEISNRFLTATQMLASDKRSVEAASMMMMSNLALSHDHYVQPVISTLVGHVMDQDRALYEGIYADIKRGSLNVARALPSMTKTAFWAINALGLLWKNKYGTFAPVPPSAAITLGDAFLYNGKIQDRNLGRIVMPMTIAGKISFEYCGITEARIVIYAIDRIDFNGCDLTGADIEIFDVRQCIAGTVATVPLVHMTQNRGQAASLRINGTPFVRSGNVVWR